jgi:ABC-type phosphate transport system substrate-binding protein
MRITGRTRVFLMILLLAIAGCAAANAQDVMVVANVGVSVSEINAVQLREIFTGVRSRFKDGSRAIPVVLKGGPAHEVFLHHYIGQDPDEFRTLWRKAVFTGQGAMLKEFPSETALLEYVAATPGAIGYVSRVTTKVTVKVLAVVP